MAEDVTRPHWFVEIELDPTVYFTTWESITWPGVGAFLNTGLEVFLRDKERPQIEIFNEENAIGALFLASGGSGKPVRIWKAYRNDGSTSTLPGFAEPVLAFEGVTSGTAINDYVTVSCRRTEPLFTPRRYVSKPTFNHLPRPGTVIEMPNQKITLE
ncbi:MAG: hypothetical protein AAGI72_15545 [Pseudomonadota bacterium]